MVGYIGEGDAREVWTGAQQDPSDYSNPHNKPIRRLETTPHQTAQRHLGAALAIGRNDANSDFVDPPLLPIATKFSGGFPVRGAVALLLCASVGGGLWMMTANEADPLLSFEPTKIEASVEVASRELPVSTEPSAVLKALSQTQAEDADAEISPSVMSDAPAILDVVEPTSIISELSNIVTVGYVASAQPNPMPVVFEENSSVIVFQDVPERVVPLAPSGVVAHELDTLIQPVAADIAVQITQLDNPAKRHPHAILRVSQQQDTLPNVGVELSSPAVLLETVEALLPLESDTPSPVDVVITTVATRSAPIAQTPNEIVPKLVTVALPNASRNAPHRSLRPVAAPANRTTIASSQFSQRIISGTGGSQTVQNVQSVSSQPRLVLSQPIQRPRLIEPKRTRLQRFLKAWGSQDITTVEQFARENSD